MAEKKKGIHYAWLIVVGCCFMQACCLGLMMNSAGIFYTPVTEDLGIGLGPLALYVTVYFFVTTFTYPFVARILPKYNINVVLSVAVAICCIGMGLMSTYTEVWQWYFSGVLYGIGGAFVFVVAATVLIENWFDKKRGLALGITQCFSGIGGAVFPLVGTMLINQIGWRSTYLILAVVAAVLVLPWTLFVFKYKPADKGLKPYGYEEKRTDEGKAVAMYPGVSAKKALLTIAFWALFLYGGVEALMSGYNTHLPGFSVSIGLGDMFGSQMLSLSMIGYVFATVIMGWLTDKIGVIIPSFITLLITALSLLGFAIFREQLPLAVCAFFFGTNSVIITISMATLVSDIFGRRDYAKILSYIRMSGCIAAFGSSAIGFVYDATGRFDISFYAGVAIIAVCAILVAIAVSQKKKIRNTLWVATDVEAEQASGAKLDANGSSA
ncbi:MFS transporter [Raoultibacter phocaeensis]|uniref:MFS transporter n=1 Tax=Raoultibacter phocaeensis TaxID=2479841 RepID=UPI0015D5709B|nr:MFS transporter [Raoultibacter phocaeensis]